MQCGLKGQPALGAFSSVCLTNWPSTFGCFCLARMKLASTRPLRWIDVAWLLPDIFTEKEGTGASNTTASVLRAKFFFYMRCENSCHNWCFNFVPGARRRNPWCLSCPAAAKLMINKFMITLNFSVSSFFLGSQNTIDESRTIIISFSRNSIFLGLETPIRTLIPNPSL